MQSPLNTKAENLRGMKSMQGATGFSGLTLHIVFISCVQKYSFSFSNSLLAGFAEETEGWLVPKLTGI